MTAEQPLAKEAIRAAFSAVRERRRRLEGEIAAAVMKLKHDFESETGVVVVSIDVEMITIETFSGGDETIVEDVKVGLAAV